MSQIFAALSWVAIFTEVDISYKINVAGTSATFSTDEVNQYDRNIGWNGMKTQRMCRNRYEDTEDVP
jgi:hypothetical protein